MFKPWSQTLAWPQFWLCVAHCFHSVAYEVSIENQSRRSSKRLASVHLPRSDWAWLVSEAFSLSRCVFGSSFVLFSDNSTPSDSYTALKKSRENKPYTAHQFCFLPFNITDLGSPSEHLQQQCWSPCPRTCRSISYWSWSPHGSEWVALFSRAADTCWLKITVCLKESRGIADDQKKTDCNEHECKDVIGLGQSTLCFSNK